MGKKKLPGISAKAKIRGSYLTSQAGIRSLLRSLGVTNNKILVSVTVFFN
jgi:hypothetical protein